MDGYRKNEFVILDTETTGLSTRYGDRLIEVAVLRVKDLRPSDVFHTLVNPGRRISYGAYSVNGISDEMLEQAPRAGEVMPQLLEFIEDRPIIGHNIRFDLNFLTFEASLAGLHFQSEKNLCTVRLAKALLPELRRYPLWLLAQALEIEIEQQHRALADVELTYKVLLKLLDIAYRRDIYDLDTLIKLFTPKISGTLSEMKNKLVFVEEAILKKIPLEIEYFCQVETAMTFRTIDPIKILKEGRYKSVLAFCHLRQEELRFRVDRIIQLKKPE